MTFMKVACWQGHSLTVAPMGYKCELWGDSNDDNHIAHRQKWGHKQQGNNPHWLFWAPIFSTLFRVLKACFSFDSILKVRGPD